MSREVTGLTCVRCGEGWQPLHLCDILYGDTLCTVHRKEKRMRFKIRECKACGRRGNRWKISPRDHVCRDSQMCSLRQQFNAAMEAMPTWAQEQERYRREREEKLAELRRHCRTDTEP